MKLQKITQIEGADPGKAWGITESGKTIEVHPVICTQSAHSDSFLGQNGWVEVTAPNWEGVRVCARTTEGHDDLGV